MALRRDMPIRDSERADEDNQGTEYRASSGGWYPKEDKPVPGAPKK
ncbi:hypothetical protein [Streptomyces alfalfae]